MGADDMVDPPDTRVQHASYLLLPEIRAAATAQLDENDVSRYHCAAALWTMSREQSVKEGEPHARAHFCRLPMP
jgi:hypothetical protein